MNLEEVKCILSKKILSYLPLIEDEYKISHKKVENIKNNIDSSIVFSHGTISFFVRGGKIYYPIDAIDIFDTLPHKKSNNSNYHGVLVDDYLNTDKSYFYYINHIIEDELGVVDYYLESTLHEVMHLCGGSGGSQLDEGFNELKTRELAQKYGLKIAAIGYQKEVEVAKAMQEIFGRDIVNKITFMPLNDRRNYLDNIYGKNAVTFYDEVRNSMDIEGKNYLDKISTIRNPFEKAKVYEEINYNNTWDIILKYRNNRK